MNQNFFDDLSNEAVERLKHAVASLPAPGEGFNPGLLPCAYAALNCGYTEDEFVWIIKANVKHGAREVVDAELRRAFKRCYMGSKVEALPARRLPWDKVGLSRIVAAGKESGAWWSGYQSLPAGEQTARQLEAMFLPLDRVWIGTAERTQPIYGQILPSMEWARRARLGLLPKYWVHMIINPLTGAMGKTKEGKDSNRCDDCVTRTDHVLIEFDRPEIPLEMQLEFWAGIEEPRLRALTYSGGKSIHAICYVGDLAWPDAVDLMRDRIYGPLGADQKVFTKSRLTRLAGSVRNNVPQHLLWSAPCREF